MLNEQWARRYGALGVKPGESRPLIRVTFVCENNWLRMVYFRRPRLVQLCMAFRGAHPRPEHLYGDGQQCSCRLELVSFFDCRDEMPLCGRICFWQAGMLRVGLEDNLLLGKATRHETKRLFRVGLSISKTWGQPSWAPDARAPKNLALTKQGTTMTKTAAIIAWSHWARFLGRAVLHVWMGRPRFST